MSPPSLSRARRRVLVTAVDATAGERLEANAVEAARARHAQRTKASYLSSLRTFLTFLQMHSIYSSLPEIQDSAVSDVYNFPLSTSNIRKDMVLQFLQFRAEQGLSYESLSSYRAAIAFLWKARGEAMPDWMRSEVVNLISGHKKLRARRAGTGEASQISGKRPLGYSLYHALMEQFARGNAGVTKSCSQRMDRFSAVFGALSWNLMSRCDNTKQISFRHIRIERDALVIHFSHTKSDQDGDAGSEEPKHVYANPDCPSVCSFLALANYFLTFSDRSDDMMLFPGKEQGGRFHENVRKTLNNLYEPFKSTFAGPPDEYGTHSFRKGATSYLCTCVGGTINVISAILRGGWTIAGAKEKYMHYNPEGDQVVGRAVSGLNLQSCGFVVLPPHFTFDAADPAFLGALQTARQQLFPALIGRTVQVPSLQGVLDMCVAQILYHRDWLFKVSPEQDPIRRCAFLSDKSYASEREILLNRLRGGNRTNVADAVGQATGIPAYTSLLVKLQFILESTPQKDELKKTLLSVVKEALDSHGMGAPHVTPAYFQEQLNEWLDNLQSRVEERLTELEVRVCSRMGRQPESEGVHEDEGTREGTDGALWYLVRGVFRRAPAGFKLPRVNIYEAWKLWLLGQCNPRVCAFRHLDGKDVDSDRRVLTEWRFVLERLVALSGLTFSEHLSSDIVERAFQGLLDAEAIPAGTCRGERRKTVRASDRSIRTIAKLWRKSAPETQN